MRKVLIIAFVFGIFYPSSLSAQYNVRKFGAKGDGLALDTRAIQQAIDEAYHNKGGIVEVPAGVYKIGTIILKDNINLHLHPGAMLLGSPDYNDYIAVSQKMDSRTKDLYAKYFMIFAEDAKYISITGSGIIHGNGVKNFQSVRPQNLRPYVMRLVNCSNVIIRDVQLLESANWTMHLLGCKDVNIDGIVIENTSRGNRDGLDIDGCQRVTVSDSRFSTTDDAIVMKASNDLLCQDITIVNCIMRTTGSAIKTGTESNGGFKNITVSNCVFKDVPNHAGIELMTVDGGMMQNILLENITMDNVNTPIFIRLGLRARPYKEGQYVSKIEEVKDISIHNVSVLNAKLPSSIMGLHSKKIQNVSISNYTVRYARSQKGSPYNEVPFHEFSYPMATMFTGLPAYGIYCRNVSDLHLRDISVYPAEGEMRAPFAFDRVENLELFSVKAEILNPMAPLVHIRNSKEIVAAFCSSLNIKNTLFEVEENSVDNLHLYNNILSGSQKESIHVKAPEDKDKFENIKTETGYSVEQGEEIKGLKAHNLSVKPLSVELDIKNKGHLQLMLLALNESAQPQKIKIKYDGVVQEFLISWKDWGWAPVTLLKEYNNGRKVNFEIMAEEKTTGLQIAKVSLIYQDIGNTD